MFRSLVDLHTLLGPPIYRSVVGGDPNGARAAAHWACGCVAGGASFERMALKTCSSHRAGQVELPAAI